MKRYYFICSIMICAAAFLTSSCSNDNEDNVLKSEEGISVITIGAPTIEVDNAGKTRMTFAYDNGLEMAWEANDAVQIAGYNSSNSYKRTFTKDYKADNTASSSSFSKMGDAITTASCYNVGYLKGCTFENRSSSSPSYERDNSSFGGSSENGYETWKSSCSVSNNPTQAGNDNTNHLKSNFVCVLEKITSGIESPTFSSSWATTHGGNFYQSACLKLILTLPANSTYTGISKIVLTTLNSSDEPQSYIKKNYDGTENTSNITLTIGDFTSESLTSGLTFTGYIMLNPIGLTMDNNSKMKFEVYFGSDTSKYIYKTITLTSGVSLAGGKLGVITLNNTGWSDVQSVQ